MSWMLTYMCNALWQIPLLLAAAWICARILRSAGPVAAHRIWVKALLACPVLPAYSVAAEALPFALWSLLPIREDARRANVHVLFGGGNVSSYVLRVTPALQDFVLVCWLGWVFWLTLKLAHGILQTRTLAGTAEPALLSPDDAKRFAALGAAMGLARLPSIATSARVATPVTVGMRSPMILLPAHSLPSLSTADLQAVLGHELAHVARRDFTKNLFYRAWSLPVAWHPALHPLLECMAETRELLCDRNAALNIAGRRAYARSLLRLALIYGGPRRRHIPSAAVGIFDFYRSHTLERRIMALNQNPLPASSVRKGLTAAACLILTAGTGAAALTLRTSVGPALAQTKVEA